MLVVGSNIAVGLCVLDMVLSVLCVPYVGSGIEYTDHHKECTYRTCAEWYAFHIWVLGFSIVIGLDILDMCSVLCSSCGWLGLVW